MKKKYTVMLTIYLLISCLMIYQSFMQKGITTGGSYSDSHVIVIDAGHGGIDPGCCQGTLLEKDINLAISKKLVQLFRAGGFVTVTTRSTDTEVYPKNDKVTWRERWQKDLEKRLNIAKEAQASLMVSIHVNSMANKKWRGAQVFFGEENPESEQLAMIMQSQFTQILGNTDRLQKSGDYYLTRSQELPVVIAEVGFLSNQDEAKLLQQEQYQDQIAWSMYCGILLYLSSAQPQ